MPELKLFRIEDGDSQSSLVDKLNHNFSSVFSFGGGPYGRIGSQGPQGKDGSQGPTGSYGDPGKRGSKWTLGGTGYPYSGNISGDFWVDVNDYNKIYQYNGTSWNPYGLNLTMQDIFRKYGPLQTSIGSSSLYGYFLTPQIPSNYTLVLSDDEFDSSLSGTSKYTFNPQYSKMVISTDSTISGRKIMEFLKKDYSNNLSFVSASPRFYWTPGASASVGLYGLNFDSNGGFDVDVSGSSFNLESSTKDINISSTGLNVNINSSNLFKVNSLSGNIRFNLGSNTIKFSTSNILATDSLFSIPNRILFESKTGQKHPLLIKTTVTGASNLRHKSNIAPSRNSYLLRSLDITNSQYYPINFSVRANGDTYYNKRIDSVQTKQAPDNSSSSSIFFKGSLSVVNVFWTVISPSVSLNSSAPVNSVNCNTGNLFVIDPTVSDPSGFFGISLWTGGTGSNYGWLDLLEAGESIQIRVKTSNPSQKFRFIGLNTTDSPDGYPEGSYGGPGTNGQIVDLTGSNLGATDVDFTIMNLIGAESGGPTKRWFKVYYSAYGGDLDPSISSDYGPVCGVLYTYNSTV